MVCTRKTIPLDILVWYALLVATVCYVWIPYWSIPFMGDYVNSKRLVSAWKIPLFFLLNLGVILGVWQWFRHRPLGEISISTHLFFPVIVLGLLLFVLQFPFLNLPVGLPGDEHYHIKYSLQAWDKISNNVVAYWPVFAALCFALMIFVFQGWKTHRKLWIWMSIGIALLTLFLATAQLPTMYHRFARYPPYLMLHQLLLANPLIGLSTFEFFHRLAVFFPYFLSCVVLHRGLVNHNLSPYVAMLPVLLFGLIPVVFYHGGLLYIEPWFFLFVTIQLLAFQSRRTKKERHTVVVAVNVLLGCVKEIAVIPVAASVTTMFLEDWRRKEFQIAEFAKKGLVSCSTTCLFLIYRDNWRDFHFHAGNFLNLKMYAGLKFFFLEQVYLPNVVLLGAGFIYLIVKASKQYWLGLLYALLYFVAAAFIFLGDRYAYFGYSRFTLTLFWVPMVLSILGLGKLLSHSRTQIPACLLLSAGVIFNGLSYPRLQDREDWGTPFQSIAERFYDTRTLFSLLDGKKALLLHEDTNFYDTYIYSKRWDLSQIAKCTFQDWEKDNSMSIGYDYLAVFLAVSCQNKVVDIDLELIGEFSLSKDGPCIYLFRNTESNRS